MTAVTTTPTQASKIAEGDKDTASVASTSAATSATASPTNANSSPTTVVVTTPLSITNPNACASQNALNDPNHWSKQEKFDADAFLECAYKKHLSRHANK